MRYDSCKGQPRPNCRLSGEAVSSLLCDRKQEQHPFFDNFRISLCFGFTTCLFHVYAELYMCSWTIVDHAMLCNMRAAELTVVEKLDRLDLRGSPGHITGDTLLGETDRRAGRDAMEIRAALATGGAAGWLRDWVSTTCCLALKKCWHVL